MPLQGQSSPVQSTEPLGKDTEHRALGPKGSAVGSLVFLALLFVFAGNGQQWLIGHASGIDAIAAEVPRPQPSAPSEASDLIGKLSKRESSNQHGCKSLNVAPWQVKKGKSPLPIPLCDETAATELIIDKYGRVERANVRDPGVIPIFALQLAAQSEQNRQELIKQLLADAKTKSKEAKAQQPLGSVVYWTVMAVLLTGFVYASLRAIKLLFGPHSKADLVDAKPDKDGENKKDGDKSIALMGRLWLLLPLVPVLTFTGAMGVGAYHQVSAPSIGLDPQILNAVSQLADGHLNAELMQLARQSMTVSQKSGEGDSGQAALNEALVKSLNQQRADLNALHDAAQSVGGAASSVSNSMVTLNGAANHLEGAAAYMAGSATKNAEAMKQIMNWVQATTQNLSFISREMSYMQNVKVNAGGEKGTTPLPDAGQILTKSTPCDLDQTGKYQIERGEQGQISVTPLCPTEFKQEKK